MSEILGAIKVFLKKGWRVYEGPAGIWCAPPERSHSRIALHKRTFETMRERGWIEKIGERRGVFIYGFRL